LDQLGLPFAAVDDQSTLLSLTAAADGSAETVTVDRISEQIQPDAALMRRLSAAAVRPGRLIHVASADRGVEVWTDGERTALDTHVSDHVFVRLS
jgi:DtxR family Mn-dependent transcriptional regulator